MKTKFDDKQFMRDMNNIINYSFGFVDGVKQGKKEMLSNLGKRTIDIVSSYIDASARVNPGMLHHVYEWEQAGSPAARLYDLTYTVSNLGLSIKSTFSQSRSVKAGSNVPFYNKAYMMENGIPVMIKPRLASTLAFSVDGEEIFTKKPVKVDNPGGDAVQGSFQATFESFFNNYLTQSFVDAVGIRQYLENPVSYANNLSAGKSRGRTAGLSAGYRWIINVGAA